MNILVTGGTTFVSRYVAEFFLRRGDQVTVLNRGSRPQPTGAGLICCDRTQLGKTLQNKQFDAVLDICAYTGGHVNALLDSGVAFRDYILISSSAVYPETNPQPFTEQQPCGSNSVWGAYGSNKLLAEQALLSRVPHAYVLRPPYFYGMYENIYREGFVFDCAMQDREFYLPGEGQMKLQFFHVSDLCRFLVMLLEKHPSTRIFNVGNPETITVKDWVTICYTLAGKQPRFVNVGRDVPQRDYFCFYDYEYVLDVSEQSRWMPHTLPLEQGLEEEFTWYRQHPESVYFRKPYIEFIDRCLK